MTCATIAEGTTRNPAYMPAGSTRGLGLSELGGLHVSQLEPDYFALGRARKLFSAVHTIATAVLPLQVVPTTTAAFTLYNASSSVLVVPLYAGLFLGSGTAGIGATLFGQVGSTPLATPLTANGSGVTTRNICSGSQFPSAFVDLSQTVAGAWAHLGSADVSAAAVPGTGFTVPLHGLFVAAPGYAFSLHAVAGAGSTAKFTFTCVWAEIVGATP